jgi:hypothetical protein
MPKMAMVESFKKLISAFHRSKVPRPSRRDLFIAYFPQRCMRTGPQGVGILSALGF